MQINKVKSAAEFMLYVQSKKPVIFEGYALKWEAHKKWDIDFFKNNFSNIKVGRMKSTSNIHPDFTCTKDWVTFESTLANYLDEVFLSGETNELSQYFLAGDTLQIINEYQYNPVLKSLSDDFTLPEFFAPKQLKTIGLWISSKGPISWLHFDKDHTDNFNVQVNGSKYVCLYDPKDAPNLYLKGVFESPFYNFSNIDVRNIDFSKMPKLENVIKYEETLNPGDMLYIPSDWLHSFTHLGKLNINLTFWWMSEHQVYNRLRSREDIILALIKYFQAECPGLSENVNESEFYKNHFVIQKLISHLKDSNRFEMFSQIENNIIAG